MSDADLFAKCDSPRVQEYRTAGEMGVLPYFREMASQPGPVVVHAGKEVVMLGSNNYLGLTADERVKRAATEAVERYGSGCTGSRLMNGTLPIHTELESELCDWLGGEACLVFTAGYLVNLGVLSTLVGPGDAVFLDTGCHASLLDGAQMSRGKMVPFKHNSSASLRRRLSAWRADDGGGALVCVEGLYSMEGDVPSLAEFAAASAEFGARLMIDEAHALGVLGPDGAGRAAEEGVRPDLLMGTFSKSLASCGGFLIAPPDVIDYLRVLCRPFLFTAASVPAAIAAALEALRVCRKEGWRRDALAERAAQLHRGLTELGYPVGAPSPGAIIPVHVSDDWKAARLWRALLDEGVYTNCALPPAVPRGRALLRTSVMATHTPEHIDRALRAFEVARSTLD